MNEIKHLDLIYTFEYIYALQFKININKIDLSKKNKLNNKIEKKR